MLRFLGRVLGLVLLLVALFLVGFGFTSSPFITVSPGPTPRLPDVVTGASDPSFESRELYYSTVEGSLLSWHGFLLERARGRSPLPAGSGGDPGLMVESKKSAAAAAARVLRSGPLPVDADTDGVSGPSAGLMLTLAYVDASSPGDLTAGLTVIGTGTVEGDGTVEGVAGVPLKVQGAARLGADVFFVAEANASSAREAAAAHAPGLEVVPVASVTDAVAWLCERGATDDVCAE